jgi:transposase-like protein
MENAAKGSDGRRLFTAEFKREQVDRILKGEITASELSRELGVARSLIQRWKYLATKGARPDSAQIVSAELILTPPLTKKHTPTATLQRLYNASSVVRMRFGWVVGPAGCPVAPRWGSICARVDVACYLVTNILRVNSSCGSVNR